MDFSFSGTCLTFSETGRNGEILDRLKNYWMKFTPGLTEINSTDVEKNPQYPSVTVMNCI